MIFDLQTQPGFLIGDPTSSPSRQYVRVWEPDKLIAGLKLLGLADDLIEDDATPTNSRGLWFRRDQAVTPKPQRGTNAPGELFINLDQGAGWEPATFQLFADLIRLKSGATTAAATLASIASAIAVETARATAAEAAAVTSANAHTDTSIAAVVASVLSASFIPEFGNHAGLLAAVVPPAADRVLRLSYSATVPGGRRLFQRVASEPTHPGKAQSADGAWWEMVAESGPITPEDFGAMDDGTGDQRAAIDNAIATAAAIGAEAHVLGRAYRTSTPSIASGVTVRCRPQTEIRLIGDANSRILAQGVLSGSPTSLITSAARADNAITVNSPAGIAAGDWIVVRSNEFTAAPFGRNQELVQVLSVSGPTLTLAKPLIGSYSTGNAAEAVKVIPCRGWRWYGGTIVVPLGSDTGGGFSVERGVDFAVIGATVTNPNNRPAFATLQSAYGRFLDCHVFGGQNPAGGGYGYGFDIDDSSHHVTISDCTSDNGRENVVGNRARHVSVDGFVASGMFYNGWNTHGCDAEHVTFRGLHITGTKLGPAFSIGYTTSASVDRNIILADSVFTANRASAIQISGMSGGALKRPSDITIANVHIDGANLDPLYLDCVYVYRADHVRLSGVSIKGTGSQANSSGIHLYECADIFALGCSVRGAYNALRQTAGDRVFFESNYAEGSNYSFYSAGAITASQVKRTRGSGTVNVAIGVTAIGNYWQAAA